MKKFKFNWGTGIAVVIALFLLANAFVIYKSLQQKYDLVAEEYYPQGLEYQKQIDRFAKANALSGEIMISQEPQALVIAYPMDLKGRVVKGQVVIFRPSDENADFTDSIQFDTAMVQRIPINKFINGKYVAKFFWKMDNMEYAHENAFRVNK